MKRYELKNAYKDALDGFHIKRVEDFTRTRTPHFHDYYQFYYVKRGEIRHILRGRQAVLRAGDAALISPLSAHCAAGSDGASLYSVSFQPAFLPRATVDGALGAMLDALTGLPSLQAPKLSLLPADGAQVEAILDIMLHEFSDHGAFCVTALRGLLIALLSHVLHSGSRPDGLPEQLFETEYSRTGLRLYELTERMKQSPQAEMSIEHAARSCAMSRAQFCKAFRETYGTSFAKYHTHLRMDMAASLLCGPAYTLEQIAAQCGFQEYSSFYRSFVRTTGISPAKYRKLRVERKLPAQE